MKRLLGFRPPLVLLNVGLLLFLVTASAHALPERQPARERGGDSARIIPAPPSDSYPQMQGTPMPAAAPDRYIVVLRPGPRDSQQEADDLSREHGLAVSHTYRHVLRGFAAQIPPGRLAALRADRRVELIAPDLPVHAFAQQASTGLRRMGGSEDGVHQTASQKGTGVGVAIIDTGIDLTHPDLAPVQNGTTCVTGTSNANDDQGHGTHVAGIVAARDNDIGVVGVAPEASLYAVKVLDRTGAGSTSTVSCGIDWVTANAGPVGVAGRIQVANVSLGRPGAATASNADCTNSNADLMHTAICRSVQAVVTYTIAVGNSSADATGYVPAAYSEGITVSALSDSDGNSNGHGAFTCTFDQDDTFDSYSNYGAPVDIAAPGSCINSTWPGGGYHVDSGTSMAAPHVAGAAALYKQANPGASPAQVKAGLLTAQEVGPIPNDPDPFHEGVVHVTSPMALPARLNSGGGSFTDDQAVLWSADRNNVGGYTFSTTSAIAGTTQDTLYQSERYGDFGYAIDVPNGTYTVTLKFAEIYFTSAGLRKFNVAIEGQTVLSNFDIVSEVPAFTALDKTFVTSVTDGTLNIVFTTILGNAKVSGIEVRSGNVAGTLTPTPIPGTGTVPSSATLTGTPTGTPGNTSTPTSTFTATTTNTPSSTPTPTAAVPRRVNAGGGSYSDTQGQSWIADTSFTGVGTYSASGAIAGTADPTLYQTGRYGNLSYSYPVPNGTYTVTLKFAEPNRNGPGRVFHVDLEGQRVLTNYDIWVDVGYLRAVDKQFVTQVADGALDIVFTSVSDAAIVSAIQVVDGSTGATALSAPNPANTGGTPGAPTATPTGVPTLTPQATPTRTPTATSTRPSSAAPASGR